MTSKAALFALLAIWGVGLGGSALPARADDVPTEDSVSEAKARDLPLPNLTDRVWVKTDAEGLPSSARIFLSDGTLVQDDCWETHRLSSWKMLPDDRVSWRQGGKEVTARIAVLTPDRLILMRYGKNGPIVEHYESAPFPDLAPDQDA